MPIGVEAYRYAVGRFATIFVQLMHKKLMKMTKQSYGKSSGKVYTGGEIALFFSWITVSALILYAAPFCVLNTFCTDFSAGVRIHSEFNETTSSLQRFPLHSCSTDFSLACVRFGHSVSSPHLAFLLLRCGDIEPNPGPAMEQGAQDQTTRLEGKLDRLMEMTSAAQNFNEQLQKRFSSFTKELKEQMSLLKDSVSCMEKSMRKHEREVDQIKKSQESLACKIEKLEERAERQERYSRRSNILIHGLKEEENESFRNPVKILDILCRYFPQKNWNDCHIERAHRLGPLHSRSRSNRPRPVIVRFYCWNDAMAVMRDREGKDRLRVEGGMRVTADLTQKQRDTVSQFKQQGKHAYYVNGRLMVRDFRPGPRQHDNRSHHPLPTSHYPQLSDRTPPHSLMAPTHNGGERAPDSEISESATSAAAPVSQSIPVGGASSWVTHWDYPDVGSHDEVEESSPDRQTEDAGGQLVAPEKEPAASPTLQVGASDGSSPSSPLRGFGRGTPVSTPEQNAAPSRRGRGRGKGVSPHQPSPVLTRNRAQSATSVTRQSTLPKDWHSAGDNRTHAR